PFLLLQLVFAGGVTGHVLQTPYQYYIDRDQPHTGLGFYAPDPDLWPESRLLQKHLYYAQFIRPETEKHRPDRIVETLVHERLPLIFRILVPHPLLIVLLSVGVLALTTLPRVVVWSVLPLLGGACTR